MGHRAADGVTVKFIPRPDRSLTLVLTPDEAALLDQLVIQLIDLLNGHSGTALDPDPLFASLEVGGSDRLPEDPALARLFPNAYASDGNAAQFRQVTEQGLLNRKLHDAIEVTSDLGLGDPLDAEEGTGGGVDSDDETLGFSSQQESTERRTNVSVSITESNFQAWLRTLTSLRLAIAARIGLHEEADRDALFDDEQTRGTVLVFDWLAAILDSLLRLTPRPESQGDF